MNYLRQLYQRSPLTVIVLAGLLFRLIAAIFSKGYGMQDDHFLVIETAQSFADGYDFDEWLPWNSGGKPSGHSWFYVGFHYIFFKFCQFIGFEDPQGKMLVIRLIHAFYSLLVITLGYKITRILGTEDNARKAAWLLALLFFIPNASVRNLVEWVCVPPLLAGCLYYLKYEKTNAAKWIWLSGIMAGIAMGIRYQSVFFLGGFGLLLMYRKDIAGAVKISAGFLIAFFITQAADLFIWGSPFVELKEYIRYNLEHKTTYFNRPWYQYLFTSAGLLLPPVSLLLMFGYFRHWKKFLAIFIPSFAFLAFHTWFPNKQERFILPFLPFLICGGVIGWSLIREHIKWKKLEKGFWKFFWIINFILLCVMSTSYTKRSRVEAMYFLYQQPDFDNCIVESSHNDDAPLLPQYYSANWVGPVYIYRDYTLEMYKVEHSMDKYNSYPNYVLFFEETDLGNRVKSFEKSTGRKLELRYTAEPSYLDYMLHRLNKRNKNQPIFVYRLLK